MYVNNVHGLYTNQSIDVGIVNHDKIVRYGSTPNMPNKSASLTNKNSPTLTYMSFDVIALSLNDSFISAIIDDINDLF